MATAAECMLKRAMDQLGGIFTRFQTRAMDIPSTAFRSLFTPSRDKACRTELMVPRRAYNAELTRCRMLAATTVSFSIKSPNAENETSSAARVASRRVKIGEKGGRALSDRSAFCFRSGDAGGVSRATPGLVWLDGTTMELSSDGGRTLGKD